jgi:ribosomal protein S18 acetylase RimI-like enzyme
MIIRRATADDADAICDVHLRSIRALCANDYTPQQIESWVRYKSADNYRKAMAERGEVLFVAERHLKIIGFSQLWKDEITSVYVAPEGNGLRAGRALVEAAEEYARQQGVKEMKLRSTITSIEFYEHLGYRRVEDTFYTLHDGVKLECVWMSKSL